MAGSLFLQRATLSKKKDDLEMIIFNSIRPIMKYDILIVIFHNIFFF